MIVKTKKIAFESTDLMSEVKRMDPDTVKKLHYFIGHVIPDYTLSILSNAIYIDEKIYNKTVEFIDTLREQLGILGEKKMEKDEFIKRVNLLLDVVSKEGFDLLRFFEIEYQKYLIKFGEKHMDK